MKTQLSKFAAPGRIAFRDGPVAPIAVVVSPYGSAEVSLYGGHVLSYRPVGHSPVLWLAESAKSIAPGKAIRGGIPVCWPWFGSFHPAGLPNHGFARTQTWSVVSTEYEKDTTSLTLGLASSEETRALWPHDFLLRLTVTVGPALVVMLETENTGATPFAITEALHSYFRVRDIANATVSGFDGQPYLDKAPGGADSVQSGPVAFTGDTDRIYARHASTAIVNDPGVGRRISIEKTGSAATVVWNPGAAKGDAMGDMEQGDWRRFVCVETANAGAEPILVAPGAKHALTATITSVLLDKDGNPMKGREERIEAPSRQ